MIQGAPSNAIAPPLLPGSDRGLLLERLAEVERELVEVAKAQPPGSEEPAQLDPREVAERVARMRALLDDEARTGESIRDAMSTQLMELFRQHRSRACFGLLYELNSGHLVQQVAARLRRYQSRAEPGDVLQEVFFNIYRYPHRFDATREDAFRVWTATIVRNTVLKHLRSLGRSGRAEVPFEEVPEVPSATGEGPLRGVLEDESLQECRQVYLTYLHLYLRFYSMLSEREQRAIHLVDVEGESYRAAALELWIKLENLKMVIFRARRKIHRSMRRVFEGLTPDCRPARDPRGAAGARDLPEFDIPIRGGAGERESQASSRSQEGSIQ